MSKILPILVEPDKILRRHSLAVSAKEIVSPRLQQLVEDMMATMLQEDGAGLAAPQVGHCLRLIVVSANQSTLAMFNPKLTKTSWLKEWGEEGCLSVPNVFGQVKRYRGVRCRFLDITGQERQIAAQGLLARVIQHEIDHLDGVLFIDKARKIVK